MARTYAWKQNTNIPVNADVAAAEIEKVRATNNGFFVPGALVKASEPTEAPLHVAFEWDDQVAAYAYRVGQARYIVNHIVVVDDGTNPNRPDSKQAYVSVRIADDEGHRMPQYTSVEVALSKPEFREQLLQDAIRDMRAFENRYSMLSEVSGIILSMRALRIQIENQIAVKET